MINESDKQKILTGITRDECAELTKQLCDIPSPTGAEREIGDFILDWYSRHGIKPIRQEIDPNRINAVGIVEGMGAAKIKSKCVGSRAARRENTTSTLANRCPKYRNSCM
jgi:acetylornithine deacetylase/succinyl-diaminopimelate desuccinylase-like protein